MPNFSAINAIRARGRYTTVAIVFVTKDFKDGLVQSLGYQPLKIVSGPSEGIWFYLSAAVDERVIDIPLSLDLDEEQIIEVVNEGIKKFQSR